MAEIHEQLLLRGFERMAEEARRRNASRQELKRLGAARSIMSAYEDDISYLHAGFCLAGLPHTTHDLGGYFGPASVRQGWSHHPEGPGAAARE